MSDQQTKLMEFNLIFEPIELEVDKTVLDNQEPLTPEVLESTLKSWNKTETEVTKQLLAKHRYTFCSTVDEPRKCATGNITCLADDRIVLSDYLWSKLKVFDKDYNFSFSQSCNRLSVVTHYTGNEIALTSREMKKVEFYVVEKNRIVELPKVFELKYKSYNMEYGNYHFAVLQLSNKGFYIGIFDDGGNEKYTIRTMKGDVNIAISRFFHMDPSDERIYISDHHNCKVACLTYNSKVMFQVPLYSFHPCGIILLEKVLVVAVSNTLILAIVPVGEEFAVHSLITKTDHVVNPSQLALQHKSKCILVASVTREYRDIIKSYQITWSEAHD